MGSFIYLGLALRDAGVHKHELRLLFFFALHAEDTCIVMYCYHVPIYGVDFATTTDEYIRREIEHAWRRFRWSCQA